MSLCLNRDHSIGIELYLPRRQWPPKHKLASCKCLVDKILEPPPKPKAFPVLSTTCTKYSVNAACLVLSPTSDKMQHLHATGQNWFLIRWWSYWRQSEAVHSSRGKQELKTDSFHPKYFDTGDGQLHPCNFQGEENIQNPEHMHCNISNLVLRQAHNAVKHLSDT